MLLTGGSTQLPEIAAVVDATFPDAVVRHDPEFVFTAVASGAARFAGGVPVDDFTYHDYAIAVQDAEGKVSYELLAPRRTRYPTPPDFAIRYYAELEMLAIYLVVITILIARPAGLFGKPVE